ncbi:DUF7711 family protein [Streptomyces mobaraensis]|uniref:DUF7711 family protein n=1 Tax=Streptomyces mobaraensis TaxID=35621 RepID=UPI0012ACD6D9|nr:hypothetical protein [Streptomyces mobaraensis]
MRYATAVRRLRTIADSCTRALTATGDIPLTAVYVFGPVLEAPGDETETVDVVFALDVPPAELPWGVEPPLGHALVELLGLDKAPVRRVWRPANRPVANHLIRRPLRIWSTAGPDEAALEALAQQRAEHLRLDDPAPHEARAQREIERAEALAHLRHLRDQYHDPLWRHGYRRTGRRPDDHLWHALDGFLELQDAATS